MAVKNTYTIEENKIILSPDCFDLALTLDCGQAFRWVQIGEDEWHGVAFSKPLTLKKTDRGIEFTDPMQRAVAGRPKFDFFQQAEKIHMFTIVSSIALRSHNINS